jgi:hypothetical protein
VANLIAGWCVFWLLLSHVLMLAAPVVADAYRDKQPQPRLQHICPKLQVSHGVGSDLRTWTKARDLCAATSSLR